MKKFISLFMFSSCLPNYNEALSLKSENEELKSQVESLQSEIDDIKNGAEYRIIEIRNEYQKGNYDKAITLFDDLHGKHNGTAEDLEASEYVSKIKEQREAEQKAKKAEAEKSAQDKAKEIIRVKRIYIYDMDSAGDVDLGIDWTNNSDKIIKYVYFSVVPYNSVGDPVKDHGKYDSEKSFSSTGPFNKGQGSRSGYRWTSAWYNSTIESFKLTKVEIEYMDGTKSILTGADLTYIQY